MNKPFIIAVVGDPGCGKTCFIKHCAYGDFTLYNRDGIIVRQCTYVNGKLTN